MLAHLFTSDLLWHRVLPEGVTNEMILADVLAEEVQTYAAFVHLGRYVVEVASAEHCAFSDGTRCNKDCIYRGVEFRMCSRHEEFFKATTTDRQRCSLRGALKRGAGGAGSAKLTFTTSKEAMRFFSRFEDVYNQRQLMHKLVSVRSSMAFKLRNHSAADPSSNPHITVDDPYDVAYSCAVSTAHVADLRIGSEGIVSIDQRLVLILDQKLSIECRKVIEELLYDGQRRIRAV